MSKPQRLKITLVCEVCGARNYKTSKARTHAERLQLKKFCPTCREHTLHKESR